MGARDRRLFLARFQVTVHAGRNRYVNDAIGDPVQVDLDGFHFGFLFGRLFVRCLGFFRFSGFFRLLFGRRGVGFLGFRSVLFIVALRLERRSFVLLQNQGEDPAGVVIVERVVERAACGIEETVGEKVEVFAVLIEGRIGVVVEVAGDLRGLAVVERIQIERRIGVECVLAVGEPAAVGRPGRSSG